MSYDVAIIGLGAVGSAAAYHLAQRGVSVLGLDRFTPPHALGSSHGQTRIIREAYFEHPLYVPLVQRAYELWAELERDSGRELLRITGGLSIGRADGVLVSGARRSALEHRLPHELLSSNEIQRRYPALHPAEDMVALWEPRAGVLSPEACIETHLALARAAGATLQLGEQVRRWSATSLSTERGEYRYRRLLIAAGAWTGALLQGRGVPLSVERQVLHWFHPVRHQSLFAPERCPVHLWEPAPRQYFYGFPDLGTGVKVAIHHGGETTTPDRVRREVADEDVQAMRGLLRRFLPDADGALRSSVVCLYTNTPDEHFWIGLIDGEATVASACSGHGFKFASVIGEVLADLLTGREPAFDLSLFATRRG
jgi:sarcosine oxidase